MKSVIFGSVFFFAAALPAHADGQCQKPDVVSIPGDAAQMSLKDFTEVRAEGDGYLEGAKEYLHCLDQVILNETDYSAQSKAGKAHQEYAQEWVPVWGELSLACADWEAAHGSAFPGGCQPMNPAG